MKKIAIIIPTFNRVGYLEKLINNLDTQVQSHAKIVIVVVADGCTDGTEELVRQKFPHVVLVTTPGDCWYTKSIDYGFKYAFRFIQPNFYLTMNDDCEINESYLFNLLSDYHSLREICILGSISFDIEQRDRVFFAGVKSINWLLYTWVYYHKMLEKITVDRKRKPLQSTVVPGRGMLIPSEIVDKIGFFDLKLPQYGSDEEYCLRAFKLGQFKTFISYSAIVYSHIGLTDPNSNYLKKIFFWKYLISHFDPYSTNYFLKDFLFVWRYGKLIYLPINFLKIITGFLLNITKKFL